jgi:hypothetical protein
MPPNLSPFPPLLCEPAVLVSLVDAHSLLIYMRLMTNLDRETDEMATTPPENLKEEKYDVSHVEQTEGVITVDTVLDPQLRVRAERALVRKLDSRLLPMIVLIFIMNYIGSLSLSVSPYLSNST